MKPFHLAIPVNNLEACREFYTVTLGCAEGRSDTRWVDLNLFGHQLVIHLDEDHLPKAPTNEVDGHDVPIPHFGVILGWDEWKIFAQILKSKNVEFVIEPYIRFAGEVGEQATMFFLDPSGNALEFKAFKNDDQIFAK